MSHLAPAVTLTTPETPGASPPLTFPSAREGWIVGSIKIAAVAMVATTLALLAGFAQTGELALGVGALACALTTPLPLGSLRTRYELHADHLLVLGPPFRWRIPYPALRSATPNSDPLSSPALSLDRLALAYVKDHSERSLNISPERRPEFLAALQARAPQLEFRPAE